MLKRPPHRVGFNEKEEINVENTIEIHTFSSICFCVTINRISLFARHIIGSIRRILLGICFMVLKSSKAYSSVNLDV